MDEVSEGGCRVEVQRSQYVSFSVLELIVCVCQSKQRNIPVMAVGLDSPV